MNEYQKSIIPQIESLYENFTPSEKIVADFFIHNNEEVDISSKNLSKILFVSEASISRFAKKCGFDGYREFSFVYKQSFEKSTPNITESYTKQVLDTYEELLNKSYTLIDEKQIQRIVNLFSIKKRVYIYGRGSSGLVAQEMKLRLMRLGVNVEAISDSHIMKMNSVLMDEECLVIGISVSGNTQEVINSLKVAYSRGSSVVLITSKKDENMESYCNEILYIAVKEHLENGKAISPQFPVLVIVDIFYAHFLQSDRLRKEELHSNTDIFYAHFLQSDRLRKEELHSNTINALYNE